MCTARHISCSGAGSSRRWHRHRLLARWWLDQAYHRRLSTAGTGEHDGGQKLGYTRNRRSPKRVSQPSLKKLLSPSMAAWLFAPRGECGQFRAALSTPIPSPPMLPSGAYQCPKSWGPEMAEGILCVSAALNTRIPGRDATSPMLGHNFAPK